MYTKSHIISRVLLKRFSYENKVKFTNIHNLESSVMGIRGVAYVKFPKILIKRNEELWRRIETIASTALDSLDTGRLLYSPQYVDNIKKLVSLHYVRSYALLELLSRKEKEFMDRAIRKASIKAPEAAEEIRKLAPLVRKKWLSDLPKLAVDLFDSIDKKVNIFLKNHYIEIGKAPEGVEFVLGDIPAVNISEDGKIGVLSGVGLNMSVGFVMPLGPKYIVAINSKPSIPEYRMLTKKQVGSMNQKSIKNCIHGYFSQYG